MFVNGDDGRSDDSRFSLMIAIVDYQMGNLRSVQRGFARVGQESTVTDDPQILMQADKVVLPGVGAFADAMQQLHHRNLVEPLRLLAESGKPLLGICLGLQLLFEKSYENGTHLGIGVLPGEVVPFQNLPPECKIPHMGWNQLEMQKECSLLCGIAPDAFFYFVHSYFVVPKDKKVVATETNYAGNFVSMISSQNIFATQFHPEKSQQAGLQMLRNFATIQC